jgi:two-component system, LytTR family, sensor kinase
VSTLDPLRHNRNALFWLLHTGGWVAYAVAQLMGAWLLSRETKLWAVICIAAASGFVLSLTLRYIYRVLWDRGVKTFLIGALVSCYALALGWRVIINTSYQRLIEPDWQFKTAYEIFGATLQSTYLLLCWSGIYFGIKYYESLQQQREAALKAQALAQEAQLKMLRYQLNPHFLFNTLNAISTLILDNDNRTANQTVMRLSDFLRYTLDQDPMKTVTLRNEIEALNLYLNTERLRFGERLRLEFAIEDAALEACVPSLLLQPLIENAVKYAVSPSESGGTIRIEARLRGTMLELTVADDGPGIRDPNKALEGRGVGLRNARDRLGVIYGDRHRFAVLDNKPGLRVEIGIPAERVAA